METAGSTQRMPAPMAISIHRTVNFRNKNRTNPAPIKNIPKSAVIIILIQTLLQCRCSYFMKPENPIKATDIKPELAKSIGVPLRNDGTGLVLILRRIPARSNIASRKLIDTPRE